MKVTRRAIVIPDQHFPIHDEAAIKVVLKAIKIVKPNVFINLGDVGEWESVSGWKYKRRKRPPLEYQIPIVDEEIRLVNEQIDRFDEALDKVGCKEKHICSGNHDEWLTYGFVEEYPYLEDYTFLKACKWKERGYKFKEWNEPLKIGKLTFIHGAYITTNHAKQHLLAYGENIMYGHTHDIQRHTLTRLGGTISSWSLGCLKDMSSSNNKWLKNKLHNWNHAFAVIDWFSNGDFIVDVVEIINGKTTLWGKTLKGE
tara:strand:+ start:50 stop:817 length:768 start_codon:yes stop_codon:yes gene_type:complete